MAAENENMADPKNPPENYAFFLNDEEKQNCAFAAASKKKSTGFMITKVSDRTNNDDNDSTDELDESRATEDLSSDFLDLSRSVSLDAASEKSSAEFTVGGCESAASSLAGVRSEDNLYHQQQHNLTNGQTRFKVVKVATTEPIRRGRWSCMDFVDPPGKQEAAEKPAGETTNSRETGSGSSSAASSVHYVPGQDPVMEAPGSKETGGDPGNSSQQNGGAGAGGTKPVPSQDSASEENSNSNLAQENPAADVSSGNSAAHTAVESIIRDTLNVDMSSGAPSTDGQSEGEESAASGAGVGAIDNKIEQAMDLVKSHLMYAVREEVEVLKERISELLEKNQSLEQDMHAMHSDWQRRLDQKDQECLALKQQLESIKPSQGQSPSSPVDLSSSPFQFSHQSSVESTGAEQPPGHAQSPTDPPSGNSQGEGGDPQTPEGEPPGGPLMKPPDQQKNAHPSQQPPPLTRPAESAS